MNSVMKELLAIKKKVANEKYEFKKNKVIKDLQTEVDYFQEEALHFRQVSKQKAELLKLATMSKDALQDDAFVLKHALLNTKSKQRTLKVELEEMKTQNTALLTTISNLQLQLRQSYVDN